MIRVKLFCLLLLFAVCAQGYAQKSAMHRFLSAEDSLMQASGNIPAFTIYKDNYIITGTSFAGGKVTKYNSDAKFQISLRHRLYRKLLPLRLYLFLTYTQKSFWAIYRSSAPFTETNYNPTIGFGRNFLTEGRVVWSTMLQFEHESNGRDSIWSRSWNRITLTGIYNMNNNYNFQAKLWIPMMLSDNRDISRYSGIGHLAANYNSDNGRIACSVLMIKRGGWNFNANWELGIAYRLFRDDNQYLYLQFYDGYGESLIHYDDFRRFIRLGFVIKPSGGSIF